MKLLTFCAKIAHKMHKLQKIVKVEKNVKKPLFSNTFFNLGVILANQISNGVFSGSWFVFLDPYRRYQEDTYKISIFLSGGAPYNLCSLLSTFAHFCPLTSFLSVSLPSDSTDMSDATEEALGIPILLPSDPLPSEMLDLQ